MSLTQRRNSNSKAGARLKTGILKNPATVFSGHEGPVYTAKFSPTGSNIASGGHDKQIFLWRLPTSSDDENINYGVLSGHKSAVTSLNWVSESTLFSTSSDSTVSFWDAETGTKTRKGTSHESVVNDCATSSTNTCVSVGDDGKICVWDERQKLPTSTINTPYPLLCCALTDDSNTIYTSGIDPKICAYDLRISKQLWACAGLSNSVTSLSLNKDSSMLVAKSMDGQIRTLSARETTPPGISRMNTSTYVGCTPSTHQLLTRAAFTRDDVYIVLGNEDFSTIVWGTASRRMVSKFAGHEGAVIDVDVHPYEKVMLSTGADGNVIVREL